MGQFYTLRYQKHLKKLSKYLKYVFNDHLMILLFFLLGGGILAYAKFLQSDYHMNLYFGRLIVILISSSVLLIGKVATLIQEADILFLLPKEQKLPSYFQRALNVSAVLPLSLLVVIFIALWPFVKTFQLYNPATYLCLSGTFILLKYADLLFQVQASYFKAIANFWRYIFLYGLAVCSLVNFGVYISLVLAALAVLYLQRRVAKPQSLINMSFVIAQEQRRMQNVYRWLNLFTDVPNQYGQIKRRQYFDALLQRVIVKRQQTDAVLYWSQVLRGNVYGNLFVRLLLISSLIIILARNATLSLVMSGLFLFLILIQMLPLMKEFDYVLWLQLMPTTIVRKQREFQMLLWRLSSVYMIVTSVLMLIYGPIVGLLNLSLTAVLLLIFLYGYLPAYNKRKKRR